ncbi:MAG: N-acetylmuramoyl-L-alanine amidase [Deltaproteobacteria bacterium]|nr:N-acetylmuramoyl-L-alanine amidase [Deltaproteobacteria bacterium]
MFVRAFAALLISLFLIPSISNASQADKAYNAARQDHSRLEKSSKLMRSRHNWIKVIDRYEQFTQRYSKDSRIDDSLYTIGELYTGLYRFSKKKQDINAAIEIYRTLVKKFPRSRLADDAVFMTGELYLNHKNNKEAAYIEFDKVLRKYPQGDMAAKARARVNDLSDEGETDEPRKPEPIGMSERGKEYINVNSIKHWSNPNYTRVVIQADRKVAYKETFLKGQDGGSSPRLFLDFSGSKVNKELMQPIEINDGLLKAARAGQFDLNTVRVVLDIESVDSYKIFALEDPYRIVIDVSGEKHEAQIGDQIESILSKNDNAVTVPVTVEPSTSPSLTRQLGLGIRRVVIDPGHGGHDTGAIGYGGIKEKNVVLEIGKKLRTIMTDKFGVEVIMTRDADIFIPLEERTAIANKAGADLFISIHANASRNKKAGGVETYFLNFATDEDSMRLAARENATTTKNIGDLQAILNDLMLNSKINESSKLARYVQGSILDEVNGNGGRSNDRGVRQAPFYVLIGAQMPSILIETSFITNKEDARRLADDKFQMALAESIADGVKRYSEVVTVARR